MAYKNASFRKLAALSALLTAIAGFGYSLTFFWSTHTNSHLVAEANYKLLLVAGFLAIPVFIELYQSLKSTDEGLAMWGLVMAILGSAGSLIHGAYGLATTITVPANNLVVNPVDPRGLLTFGLTGVAIYIFGYLIWRTSKYSRWTWILAKTLGILLVAVYAVRLWAPDSGVTFTKDLAAIVGFVLAPAWYLLLASQFQKR